MLGLKQCLRDIANAWPKISVGAQSGSLKIGSLLIQWGTSSKSIASKDADSNIIVFPTAYSSVPVVFAQSTVATNFAGLFMCGVKEITVTQFAMSFHNTYTVTATIQGNWLAIGVK